MIYRDVSGLYYSSVAPTGAEGDLALNFIGDAFLRNVVSVFDFGKEEIRFAARTDGDERRERDDVSRSEDQPISGALLAYTPCLTGWLCTITVILAAFC